MNFYQLAMNLRFHSGEAALAELHGGGRFVLSREDFVPAYVRAYEEGLLQERAGQAVDEPAERTARQRELISKGCARSSSEHLTASLRFRGRRISVRSYPRGFFRPGR